MHFLRGWLLQSSTERGATYTPMHRLRFHFATSATELWQGRSEMGWRGLRETNVGVTSKTRTLISSSNLIFDMAYEFSEGMATVVLDKRTGYVNLNGELAVPTSFLRGERFSDGVAAVDVGTGEAHRSIADACETGFINSKGAFVITPQVLLHGKFSKRTLSRRDQERNRIRE